MDSKRKTELAARLREDVGNPSESRLSDTALLLALESARKEYSKFKGTITIGSFTTVANQDEYTYDIDVVCRVINVLPSVSTSELRAFGIPEDAGERTMYGAGSSIFDNPSMGFIHQLKVKLQRHLFDGSWEDRGAKLSGDPAAYTGIIALLPAPTTAGNTIYYEYRKWLEFEQIPPRDEDILMLWAQAEAMEKIANRTFSPSDIRSVSGGGQSISYGGADVQSMKTEIRAKRREFNFEGLDLMALDYAEAMREAFDHLREHVQGNQTASVLRYDSVRDPVTGAYTEDTTPAAGLADLEVVVEDPTDNDIQLGRGQFDLEDRVFVFYDVALLNTDQVLWNGSTYSISGFRSVPGTTMLRVLAKRTSG